MDQVISTPRLAPLPSALQPLQQPGSLPTEILIEVFLLSLPPLNFAQAPHKTTLALVCRFWNAVLDSTPVLWSGVSIADSITYVRRSLLKSGECPIDVYADRPHPEFWPSTDEHPCCDGVCCKILAAVGSHARRWRDVALKIWCLQKFTPSVATFPSLQSLELHSGDYWPVDDGYLLLLNGANTPHLRELRLRATQISRWDLISFPPSLSKLEIRQIDHPRPSANRLISILSTCPNLTVLRLCYFSSSGTDQPDDLDGKAPAVVELSALQELELNVIQYPYLREILKRLRIPEECIVSLIPIRLGDDSSPPKYSLTPTFWQHRERFQNTEVTLTLAPWSFLLLAVCQRWRIVLDWEGSLDAIRDVLQWFDISMKESRIPSSRSDTSQVASTIFNSGAITLKLQKGNYIFDVESRDLAPVSDCQRISRIEFYGFDAWELASLLLYLSGREDPDQPSKVVNNDHSSGSEQPGSKMQTTRVWPFPRVSELVLEGVDADAMRALLGAIKSRSGDGSTAGTPGMPARLKRVELDDDEVLGWGLEDNQGVDAHEAEQLLLEILDALDDDAELIWKGKRIFKA
ncbi:hypothetical protein FRC00_006379 [Tulasnella sp. 408]|nr:hypothetical protein FRC00_006379 [Tulasnella sp. 408]